MAAEEIKVTNLNIFPIKSCHALRVEEVKVGPFGLEGDRRFMLVDGSMRFLSQRKFSKLATVHPRIVLDENGDDVVHVSAPGMERDLKFRPVLAGNRTEASIWEDEVMVIDQGEEAAQWFSDFIGPGGIFSRLVASAESSVLLGNSGVAQGGSEQNFHRPVSNLPASLKQRLPEMQVALADAGPVSLVSQESLGDVNVRLRERGCEAVPLNRFRMNIEVCGCSKPFEEDEWLLIRIGEVPFLAYINAEVSLLYIYLLFVYSCSYYGC